jgi:site-specific DNA recombinase
MNTGKKKKRIRAVSYSRFSNESQRDESIEAQLRAINKYALDKGMEIVEEYIDKAKTATNSKRPAFQKMIKDSENGLFDVIIVHKLDRFSRDKYDSVVFKRQLLNNGVIVLSVLENLDGSPESEMMECMYEGFAAYYSKNLAREVMKGMLENAYKCLHTGGIAPLGYDVVDKKLVINKHEAVIVKTIFNLFSLDFGYGYIIKELNSKGYKTKLGKPFGKNSLHNILSNEKYVGTYIYNRAVSKNAFNKRNAHASKDDDKIIRIEGGIPAIVEIDIFNKVKAKMQSNRKNSAKYKTTERYLLSGLIICGECGYAMQGGTRNSGKNKIKYSTYRCGGKEHKHSCDNKEINKLYIEEYVLRQLKLLVFNEKKIPSLIKRLDKKLIEKSKVQTEEISVLQKNLRKINLKIENIIKAIEDGVSQSTFVERLNQLEEDKSQVNARIETLNNSISVPAVTEDDVIFAIKRVRTFINKNNIPECKQFILDYVEKVVVFKESVELVLKTGFSKGECSA